MHVVSLFFGFQEAIYFSNSWAKTNILISDSAFDFTKNNKLNQGIRKSVYKQGQIEYWVNTTLFLKKSETISVAIYLIRICFYSTHTQIYQYRDKNITNFYPLCKA